MKWIVTCLGGAGVVCLLADVGFGLFESAFTTRYYLFHALAGLVVLCTVWAHQEYRSRGGPSVLEWLGFAATDIVPKWARVVLWFAVVFLLVGLLATSRMVPRTWGEREQDPGARAVLTTTLEPTVETHVAYEDSWGTRRLSRLQFVTSAFLPVLFVMLRCGSRKRWSSHSRATGERDRREGPAA